MCAIAGLILAPDRQVSRAQMKAMLDIQYHRGPDEEGMWIEGSVGLGVRRLSIIDLETGSQPIWNEANTACVICNGEIFNYLDLRAELLKAGHSFRTKSDTEVIIHGFEEWGHKCVDHFNGQFAFCVYDKRSGAIFLARDRMGEKPLYYHLGTDRFVFASEIKALLTQVDSAPHIPDDFWAFELCLDGETLFEGIKELPPATTLTIGDGMPLYEKYWRIPVMPDIYGVRQEDDLIEELRYLLFDAVRIRMVADVPVGVALSGGLDSAAIAYLAKPDKVFSCRFPLGPQFDEWSYASLIASEIGAEHFTVSPTVDDFRNGLSDIIWHLDQPVATASPIGDFAVCREAAKQVKVLLGGQGSDELFGGYTRYLLMDTEARIAADPALCNYLPMMRHMWGGDFGGDPALRYWRMLKRHDRCANDDCHYQTVKNLFRTRANLADAMGRADIELTLPALIQMNDRSSAAYGVENRNPFLDHRLVEFAFRLPPGMKIRDGQTKWILRQALRGIVPDEILDRRDKKGLVVPFVQWLTGPLASWRDDLLRSLARRIPFGGESTRGEFDRRDYTLCCLELWFRRFFPGWKS